MKPYLVRGGEWCVEAALAVLLKPGMTFYDIGAKHGHYAMLATQFLADDDVVVAFEPEPRNFEKLVEQTADWPNIQCAQVAIGEYNLRQRFLRSADSVSLGKLVGEDSDDSIFVDVMRLDNLHPPALIKMDIEGGEVAALRGASRTLTEARSILLIEMHGNAAAIKELLQVHGYVATTFGNDLPLTLNEGGHIIAVPSERWEILAQFRSVDFPACDRCRAALEKRV